LPAFSDQPVLETEWLPLAAAFAGHAALGFAMHHSGTLATLHALATFAAGMWIVFFSPRIDRILCVIAYATGADVLWRMCGASVPWEFSKYSIAVLSICALIRFRRYRIPAPALLYFLLLLPSAIVTAQRFKYLGNTISRFSMFLSGPFAVACCACFLVNVRLTRAQINQVLLALTLPISGVVFIAGYGTFTKPINFGTQSLHDASGDFGPNQVSSILGFGALLLILYLLRTQTGVYRKLLLVSVIVALLGQCALTFSRGGLYAAVCSLVASAFFYGRDRRTQKKIIYGLLGLAIVGALVLFPLLNSFTRGALEKRFEETGLTGREVLMKIDFDLFLENPVYGVGVGLSQYFHPMLGTQYIMNHNEFTRMLCEHGLFGVLALLVVITLPIGRLFSATTNEDRAFVVALYTWCALFLFVNGFRISAPSFCFAFALVRPRID
jgi:hypothetical protein